MHAALGEVAANLENAEHWVRLALREGAQSIVLPEFFTTAIALHPTRLVNAYRTLEGLPMQLLKSLAKEGNAHVGGSFLARSGADVFNTFVLASPGGQVYTHDKDFPTTNIETSVYAGGEDDEFVKELARRGVQAEPPAPIPSRTPEYQERRLHAAGWRQHRRCALLGTVPLSNGSPPHRTRRSDSGCVRLAVCRAEQQRVA